MKASRLVALLCLDQYFFKVTIASGLPVAFVPILL